MRFVLAIIFIATVFGAGGACKAAGAKKPAATVKAASELPYPQAVIDLDITPPSLSITSHNVLRIDNYSGSSIKLGGVVTDDLKVANVKWYTTRAVGGDCTGIESWSADIPLFPGENLITVAATDLAGNIGADCITVVCPRVDITMVVPASNVVPGQTVTITLQYVNSGTAVVNGVAVTAIVPVGMDYVAGSAESSGGTWNASARTVSWTVDSLASLQSGSRGFKAKVK